MRPRAAARRRCSAPMPTRWAKARTCCSWATSICTEVSRRRTRRCVAGGTGQVQDVADAPGTWNNNPAFKNLHSQDPQSTMDDRFDIQFASGEFFDGVGLEYVGNSYHVFGNNGTHTLDMPITTGTGASAAGAQRARRRQRPSARGGRLPGHRLRRPTCGSRKRWAARK